MTGFMNREGFDDVSRNVFVVSPAHGMAAMVRDRGCRAGPEPSQARAGRSGRGNVSEAVEPSAEAILEGIRCRAAAFPVQELHEPRTVGLPMDQMTARALVDAGYMPLSHYVELFGAEAFGEGGLAGSPIAAAARGMGDEPAGELPHRRVVSSNPIERPSGTASAPNDRAARSGSGRTRPTREPSSGR